MRGLSWPPAEEAIPVEREKGELSTSPMVDDIDEATPSLAGTNASGEEADDDGEMTEESMAVDDTNPLLAEGDASNEAGDDTTMTEEFTATEEEFTTIGEDSMAIEEDACRHAVARAFAS